MRHLLTDTDVSPRELADLVQIASLIKRRRDQFSDVLRGRSIGLLFEKPSLRTRVSSETAATLLGAHPIILRGDELHLHRGETPEDSARVLTGYLDLLMARVLSHGLLESFASVNCLPIVNGLSDTHHPLQALADMLTIHEAFNGRLEGRRVCYVGDCNNVATSLVLSGVALGLDMVVACPNQYRGSRALPETALLIGERTGGSLVFSSEVEEAAAGADVLYTDVWISMGDEGEEQERRQALAPYQLNESLIRRASDDVVVMHCLPANFGEEITREAFDGPQSRILRQAHNRLPATAAVFLFLLDRERFYKALYG